MKVLVAIALLALVGCNDLAPAFVKPKFKVGDCIVSKRNLEEWNSREPWETVRELYIEKVMKLDKEKYLTASIVSLKFGVVLMASTPYILDEYYKTIECPKELKEFKYER